MGLLFNHDSSGTSNHTCPTHSLDENASVPWAGSMSFFTFNKILAGSCTAFATVVIIGLMFLHATHLSQPKKQVKIMRIAILIPSYSIFSFLSICFPRAAVYLSPWRETVQSFALGTFFLLMCECISESPTERDLFFSALVVANKKGKRSAGGIAWYRRMWISIFQYPVVALLAAVLTDITQAAGVYCEYASKPYFARLWIKLASTISLVIAVLAVLKFYLALKTHLATHQPLAKLLAFKIIVFFAFIINIVFWALTTASVLQPSSTLTYADLHVGLPELIICLLMVPLSLFFHYAYSVRPFLKSNLASAHFNTGAPYEMQYHGGFLGWKAWLKAANPLETFRAIFFAFTMAGNGHGHDEPAKHGVSAPPPGGGA